MQLNRSIAFTASWKYTFFIALILGGLLAFILVFLQPFDTWQNVIPYKELLLSGYSLCIIIPVLLLHILETNWYQKNNSRWNVLNEIVILTLGFLFIGFLSFLYNTVIVNDLSPQWPYFWQWLRVFGLPFVPLVIPAWAYLRYKFSDISITATPIKGSTLSIQGENLGEKLQFSPDQFIYAQSQSNYVDVYLLNENQEAEKHVLRSTLSGLVSQLPFAEQVHRSYLVNPEHIKNLEGNTRKGAAVLNHIDEPVPVSPKHFKGLKNYLQSRP